MTELAAWFARILAPTNLKQRLFYEKLFSRLLENGKVYMSETFRWEKERTAQYYVERLLSKDECRLLVKKRDREGRWLVTVDLEALGKLEKLVKRLKKVV